MEMGSLVDGTKAMFCAPVKPGPAIKNPKTSLKFFAILSGYSSEANTNLNFTWLACGLKEKEIQVASKVGKFGLNNCKSASPGKLLEEPLLPILFGPMASITFPVDKIRPLSKPMLDFLPLKKPIFPVPTEY